MNALKQSLLALAIAGTFVAGAAHAQVSDNVIKIGVLSDMSSLYTDLAGAGSVLAAKMAVEDSGIEKRGYKVEFVSADHQNKPDVGSAIARQWYDTDKVDVIVDVPNSGVALAVSQITKDKGKVFLAVGPGIVGPDGQGMLAEHRALGVRHLDARQRHRHGDHEAGRRHVVLHHRRLRIRAGAGARHDGSGDQGRGQGARRCPRADQQPGLLVVPAAGAVVEGEGHRPRQRGRRHDELDQAGGRVRHRQGRPESRRPARVPHRHSRAGPQQCAGTDLHRDVLLGHERPDTGVCEALRAAGQGHPSDDGPCGCLLRPCCTTSRRSRR